jgi:HEAT repeat protein
MRAHAESIRDIGFLPEGEMHTRAPGVAPHDLARDPAKYPFARIYDTADLASNLAAAAVPELRRRTADPDSAVRHWAALGLLMRGRAGVTAGADELRGMLKDVSPLVRIVAAEALTAHGAEADASTALEILKDYAAVEKHGVFVAMAALNAIEALGPRAAELKPYLATLGPKGPSPDNRYDSYVPRQLASVTGREIADPEEAPAPKARGKGKRKSGEKQD